MNWSERTAKLAENEHFYEQKAMGDFHAWLTKLVAGQVRAYKLGYDGALDSEMEQNRLLTRWCLCECRAKTERD